MSFVTGIVGFVATLIAAIFYLVSTSPILPRHPQPVATSSVSSQNDVIVGTSTSALALSHETTTSRTPTPKAPPVSANWPVFSNKKYSFIFKYPPTWTLERNSDMTSLSVTFTTSDKELFDMEVQQRPAANGVTPQYMKEDLGASRIYTPYRTIAGVSSVGSGCGGDMGECTTINFQKGTSFFNIDVTGIPNTTLNAVLDSFQITAGNSLPAILGNDGAISTSSVSGSAVSSSLATSTTVKANPQTPVEVFYQAPYIPMTPGKGVTTLKPSGSDGSFTKEDAIAAAKQKGFFRGQQISVIPSFVSLRSASSTGSGQAWFATDEDYHASTSACATSEGSSVIFATFEMNTITGLVDISNKCGVVFY